MPTEVIQEVAGSLPSGAKQHAAVAGLLLGIALSIKLTAIAAVAGLAAWLVTTGRR